MQPHPHCHYLWFSCDTSFAHQSVTVSWSWDALKKEWRICLWNWYMHAEAKTLKSHHTVLSVSQYRCAIRFFFFFNDVTADPTKRWTDDERWMWSIIAFAFDHLHGDNMEAYAASPCLFFPEDVYLLCPGVKCNALPLFALWDQAWLGLMSAKSQDDSLLCKCKYETGWLKRVKRVLKLPVGDFHSLLYRLPCPPCN